jgi:hypothetical protein
VAPHLAQASPWLVPLWLLLLAVSCRHLDSRQGHDINSQAIKQTAVVQTCCSTGGAQQPLASSLAQVAAAYPRSCQDLV